MYKEENFQNLPLKNNFMFAEIMRQEKICKLFLEALLRKPVERIDYIDKEKTLSDSAYGHGVRLDVYLRDEN